MNVVASSLLVWILKAWIGMAFHGFWSTTKYLNDYWPDPYKIQFGYSWSPEADSWTECIMCHLVKVSAPRTVCYLVNLSLLISKMLLFVEFLSQGLQFSESQLQGQPITVGLWSVFQHVLNNNNKCEMTWTQCDREQNNIFRRLIPFTSLAVLYPWW